LALSPTHPQYFASFDGTRIAYRELGEGRPVVLIHGYFSTAEVNWIKYGHAAAIAAKGFRVIMPDLRGHGASDKPHDLAAYPADALMRDGMALIAHLGLSDYDLGGYSLGGRTTMRMLAKKTSDQPKGDRDHADKEHNLIYTAKGDRRLQLKSDKSEWLDYMEEVEDRYSS